LLGISGLKTLTGQTGKKMPGKKTALIFSTHNLLPDLISPVSALD